jgi:hypothetical protein
MFDFSIIVVSVIGAGSLALSFLEYTLNGKRDSKTSKQTSKSLMKRKIKNLL